MMSVTQPRVILVTGANKGIGFELVKKLATNPSATRDVILLGARDEKRGQQALVKLGSPPNVHLLLLDTTSRATIERAAKEVGQKYGGHLDILVNNAGIGHADVSAMAARRVIGNNYFAVKTMNEHFLPLLRENGRVVNVSSVVGAWTLHGLPPELRDIYLSPTLTEQKLDHLLDDFISAIDTNTLNQTAYEAESLYTIYNVSKMALNVLTRIQARDCTDRRNIMMFAVCPGFCDTDMTGHAPGLRSPGLGADSILHVINRPREELQNGELYQDGVVKPRHFAVDQVINGSTSSVA